MNNLEIQPNEIVIDSDQAVISNRVKIQDARITNERIYWLINNYLKKVFDAYSEKLYQDPKDKRFWELTYPKGYMNGWGIPRLTHITKEDAEKKYKVETIKPEEFIIDSNSVSNGSSIQIANRIYKLAHNYLKKVFDIGYGKGLYQDPQDFRLWELTYSEKDRDELDLPKFRLSFISSEEAKIKYNIEEIQANEIVINSGYDAEDSYVKNSDRIYQLTHNHLKKIADVGWEVLYQDPKDHRFWELTYPKGEMHGGGIPKLSYIARKEAIKKYKINR